MPTHPEQHRVMPDVLATAIAWLSGHPLMLALGPTISVDLAGYTAGVRWLTVDNPAPSTRDPGGVILRVPIDLNAYGEDKAAAHLLARSAVTALQDMWGWIHNDTQVCGVLPVLEAFAASDPENLAPRYIAEVAVFARPLTT